MGYRKDLESAQARIVTLEEEVERLRERQESLRRGAEEGGAIKSPLRLMRQIVALKQELAEATERAEQGESAVTHWRSRYEQAQKHAERLAYGATEQGEPPSRLLSLVVHNRSRDAFPINGERAGVLCPSCLISGDRVELHLQAPWHQTGSLDFGLQSVLCPRCAFHGLLRPTP